MRRAAIAAAAVALFVGGGSTAYFLTDSALSSATSCRNAVTELLQAKRIIAPSQSYAKDNPAESVKVFAYLRGGVKPTGVTSHMGLGLVQLEDTCREFGGGTTSTTTTTTTTTDTTTTTTTSPPGGLTLQQVDGGTSYYAQFSNPLPTVSSYFPIGAWFRPAQDASQFQAYSNFGLNLFVGVECPECTTPSSIGSHGMKAFIQADERTRFSGLGAETAGWLVADELDMQCGPPCDGYTQFEQKLATLPNDGRLRYANYGKGVLEWESDADSAKWINGRNGGNTFQQVVSTDLYWFTDPGKGSERYGSNYGNNVGRVRQLDALDGKRQAVWNFVELGWPFTESASAGGRRILPAEIRSAVWHSIIAGARGIIYFDHNFGPGTPGSTILGQGYTDNQAAATAVDAQIKSLAPVLNSPSVTSGNSAAGDIRYLIKWDGSNFYVFAGANRGGGSATFSIPCVGNATAARLGESGSVSVSGGSFTDSFADKNAVHIYRIDGGSRCGF